MSKYETPKMPFVESRYKGGKQRPTAIILTPSFTTSQKGAALGIVNYWNSPSSPHDSGHYAVDEVQRFRAVDDRRVAGHLHCADKGAIRITICAEPFSRSIFWHQELHLPVLYKAAELVAELTMAYNIRSIFLDEKGIELWRKHPMRRRGGIFVDEVSGWPAEAFLSEVKAQQVLKTYI